VHLKRSAPAEEKSPGALEKKIKKGEFVGPDPEARKRLEEERHQGLDSLGRRLKGLEGLKNFEGGAGEKEKGKS